MENNNGTQNMEHRTWNNPRFRVPCSVFRSLGFTLIELLVTIGIFIFMTSVVLAKYHSFSTNSDFANTVEGLVLSLREAQVYGVGSKTAGDVIICGTPPSSFNCSYGIYLSKIGGSNGSYVIFVDVDKDGLYNPALDTIVQTANLWVPSGIWISDIMVNNISQDTLSITFKRPTPDAIINGVPGNTSASITIQKGAGDINKNIINITSSGQISIQ
ncbi:MAG: type II secretion system protein [Candidatus Yonathbacteria bacterium]|nr:type II secretion system protein [Candidatus Yonathbacteria bacterium]